MQRNSGIKQTTPSMEEKAKNKKVTRSTVKKKTTGSATCLPGAMLPVPISVSNPWFDALFYGKKTIEGRLNKGKFALLNVGSVIVISRTGGNANSRFSGPPPPNMVAVVTDVMYYKSFEDYLSQEGLARTLPGVCSISDGVSIYHQFYTIEQERNNGVVAIHLRRPCFSPMLYSDK